LALKDEVYRRMFRLEENRPGAALDLAATLLRAFMAYDSGRKTDVDRQWLSKIAPICLSMIEATAQADESALPDDS
jgi:hypothetical protein